MLRSFFALALLYLPLTAAIAQNCPPPAVAQAIYIFPTEAQYTLTLTEANLGWAELAPQGQPFDSAVTGPIVNNRVYFHPLLPNTTYQWRARANCNIGGLSDWSPVYTFTTPPPCPLTVAIPLDTVITITFPAAPNPNIGHTLCEVPTRGDGYVFSYPVTVSGDYRLTILEASGGHVRTGIAFGTTNFCRGTINCLTPFSDPGIIDLFPANAGEQLVLAFSASPGVMATRRIRLSYSPCGTPGQLYIDTIKPDLVRVFAFSAAMDVEIKLDRDSFTGLPDYVHITGPVTLANLTPGASYHWRGRGNCGTTVSPWLEGPGFTTPHLCDSIPRLRCDSTYAGFPAGAGRQKMFRYRPTVSHEMRLTTTGAGTGNNTLSVALRDSTLGDCFSSDWPVDAWSFFACCGNVPDTLSMGYVEAGKTYYVYANKNNLDPLAATLRWSCPSACPAPGKLTSALSTATAVILQWHNNERTENWEIELRTDPGQFTGIPQFSGTGSNYTATGLLLGTHYYWRIRNVCGGAGSGEWSKRAEFYTPLDCAEAIEIVPDNTNSTFSLPGFSLLNTCPDFSGGVERYYRFTPTENGEYLIRSFSPHVSFSYKPLTADCGAATGWICLGADLPFDQADTWSFGPLVVGQPYLIAVDYPPYAEQPSVLSNFILLHPTPCPAPAGFSVNDVTAHTVQLGWASQASQLSWEIEVQPNNGTAFTGIPNYFSTQNSGTITGLLAATRYKFQVRARCGALGQSYWSGTGFFVTLPDCTAYPLLSCEQEVTLHFAAGEGYWGNLPNCPQYLTGREEIVQFTANAPTHYIFLPGLGAYAGFYLKNAAGSVCAETTGWQCVGNSDSTLLTLPNLTPGATYYLLCKRRETFSPDSLRLSLHCTLPCVAPRDPQTVILPGGSWVLAKWDGGNGPWTYQVALRYPDGSELTQSNVAWNYDGRNLLEWFTVNNSAIHAWRVRTICHNGDTSAWTPYSRFRLPRCADAEVLPCHDTVVSSVDPANQYYYNNVCDGNTEFGQQRVYRLVTPSGGDVTLRLDLGGHTQVRYALSENMGTNCGASTNWPLCGTLHGDTLLQLSNLGYGNYLIQFATSDSLPLAPIIETFCPCLPSLQGQGFLYSNGQAALSWYEPSTTDRSLVEIVPVGTPFSGTPNYFSDSNTLIISGLDLNLIYKFRVRNQCGGTQYSDWSPAFPVTLLEDCATMPTLACGTTLDLAVSPGSGLFDYHPCGSGTLGDEAFFKIIPAFTGTYSLDIISVPNISSFVHLGFLSACDSPNSTLTCIGYGGIGEYELGYLQEGQAYYIVADQSNFVGGIYKITLHCALGNDNPTVLLGNPDSTYIIAVGDSCQVFSNQNATANNDPDPSQPPGNWYDATEHSVWFAFVAPPGGTVQITAASDPSQPFDPQVALLTFDTLSGAPFALLATGEDNAGPHPADAVLIYTGLTPGQIYYILVDGANGSSGRFCLTIRSEPDLWLTTDVCKVFPQSATPFDATGAWRNLYTDDGPHVTGALLGALRTVDDLGAISVSTEILPDAPILPNGQKILPRYFNFETEFAPQNPVTLRLFFTAADLAAFNLAPPTSSATPLQLGLTHYDGDQEDCDPTNNALTGGLAVNTAQATLVGANGMFYLEAVFDNFSEFGAALMPTVGTSAEPVERLLLSAFPNPFDAVLQLQLHSPTATSLDFQLFDVLASPVHRGRLAVEAGENVAKLDLPDLAPGVYQLVLYRGGSVVGRWRVVKI